jgi:hypothetical protein
MDFLLLLDRHRRPCGYFLSGGADLITSWQISLR